MDDTSTHSATAAQPVRRPASWTSGAFGAGLVLVVLPSAALVLGIQRFAAQPAVGLPIVAVLGIMILFGALALVSTLFARLGLDDRAEALGLPAGSIRAFIALALIVLFALISVMLFESYGDSVRIDNLSEEQKAALVKEPTNHVTAVVPQACAASAPACAPGTMVYTAYLTVSRGSESSDLSKQLLILVGTLMTSVVSFYFAARATEATTKNVIAAIGPQAKQDSTQAATAPPTPADNEAHVDGCGAPVTAPTADQDLPPATGGVAS